MATLFATGPISPEEPAFYPEVGHCIYCGRDGKPGTLQAEHIIALGLQGGFVLPKASCAACARITGSVESVCLNEHFWTFRSYIEMRSGRRRSLPKGVRRHRGGFAVTKRSSLVVPEFGPPLALQTGHARPSPLIVMRRRVVFYDDPVTGNVHTPEWLASQPQHDPLILVRMLSKIGHALAVAEIGEENFSPLLIPTILGDDTSMAGALIGRFPGPEPEDRTIYSHEIGIRLIPDERFGPVTHWVVARIRLFSIINKVTYAVVVGRATPTLSLLDWHGLSVLSASEIVRFRQRYGIPLDPPYKANPNPPWARSRGSSASGKGSRRGSR
jgi:hypothetical protein